MRLGQARRLVRGAVSFGMAKPDIATHRGLDGGPPSLQRTDGILVAMLRLTLDTSSIIDAAQARQFGDPIVASRTL